MTSTSIEIESLKGQVVALKARVSVTEDLEALVSMLKTQLEASRNANLKLEQSLET